MANIWLSNFKLVLLVTIASHSCFTMAEDKIDYEIPYSQLNLSSVNSSMVSMETQIDQWASTEEAEKISLSQAPKVNISLTRMALCCRDNPDAINCPASPNNCNEFEESLQRGLDEGFTELGNLFFRISPQIEETETNPANAFNHSIQCTNCFEPAYRKVSSAQGADKFYDSLDKFKRDFTDSVSDQMVFNSFQAFHQYNDMLHKHMGLYGKEFERRVANGGTDQYLCKDSNKIKKLLENPKAGSRCDAFKRKHGDKFQQEISKRSSRWFDSQGLSTNKSFIDNFESYTDNFAGDIRYPQLNCTNRTEHAQVLAAQFHSASDQAKKRADLVYGLMDEVFSQSVLESQQVKAYCEQDGLAAITPFDHLIGEGVLFNDSLVKRVLATNQNSELRQLIVLNGITQENFLEEFKQILIDAQLREPTLGILLSNKTVFCESYIAPRRQSANLKSKDIVRKKGQLAVDFSNFQKTAAQACDSLYQNIADSLCIDELSLGNLPGSVLHKALKKAKSQSKNLSDLELQVLGNSISCSHRAKTSEQSLDDRFQEHMSNLYQALPEASTVTEWGRCYQGAGAELNYDQFKQLAVRKNPETGALECQGGSHKEEAENFYSLLGLSKPAERAAFNLNELGGVSEVALKTKEPLEQLAKRRGQSQLSNDKCSTYKQDQDFVPFKRTAVAEDAVESNTNPAARSDKADGVDSAPGGGVSGAGVAGTEVNTETGMSGDEIREAASGGGNDQNRSVTSSSRGRGGDDDFTGSDPRVERSMQQLQDLQEQSRQAQQNYQRVRNKFQQSSSSILNEGQVTTNDVAENVDNKDFIEVRDAIVEATGVDTDEASQALINSLTNSDDGELESKLASGKDPQLQELLAQIADLKQQIKESKEGKRAQNVADLDESSEEYIKELEKRIKELETGGSKSANAQSRLRTQTSRSPASTLEGESSQNLRQLKSLGGISSGRPSLFTNPADSPAPRVNPIGNAIVMNNIIKNPEEYLEQGDFNFEYRNNRLYLKVNRADLNEPVDIQDVYVNDQGVVEAVVLPGNKTLPVNRLSESSRQALSQYVVKNNDRIEQSRAEQVAVLKEEVARVRNIQSAAKGIQKDPNSESAYQQLLQAFGN